MKRFAAMLCASTLFLAPTLAAEIPDDLSVDITHVVTTGSWSTGAEPMSEADETAMPATSETEEKNGDEAVQEAEVTEAAETPEEPEVTEADDPENTEESASADEELAVAGETDAMNAAGLQKEAGDAEGDAAGEKMSGNYRLIAVSNDDGEFGSRLYVQRLSEGEIIDTVEVQDLAESPANITDIRPNESFGTESAPGLTAFVFLQSSPDAVELDTYELFIDEFGDMIFGPATN